MLEFFEKKVSIGLSRHIQRDRLPAWVCLLTVVLTGPLIYHVLILDHSALLVVMLFAKLLLLA